MIRLFYEGVDISEDVAIKRCYHDMYAGGISDTLNITFFDGLNLWDRWSPKNGDEIKVEYGGISTGAMFVVSINSKNGLLSIIASSAPPSGFVRNNKAWQQVRFYQIIAEIAERNALSYELHGVDNHLYSYILQNNESDFSFLHRLTMQESCSFLVYNKKLVIYSEPFFESVTPQEILPVPIDADYKYFDRSSELYGSCEVVSGRHNGRFDANNGVSRILRPQAVIGIGSNADAERFAKGILRAENKHCRSGYVKTQVLTGYSAASTLALQNDRAPSWNGAVFVDHIRNDYSKGNSKLFFRKPLEVY